MNGVFQLFHNDLRLVELDLKALENAKQDEWKEISSDRIEINPLAAAVSDLENLKMLADESSVVFQVSKHSFLYISDPYDMRLIMLLIFHLNFVLTMC